MDKIKLAQRTIALLSSMVHSGEQHTARSSEMVENALKGLEQVKNCSIHDILGQSEQLKAVEKLKDFAYEVCPLHREDDLEKIVGSL